MFNFDVNDMSECEFAVAIVKAVMAVDEGASVYVDMDTRGVEVSSGRAGAAEFLNAIVGAGFKPVLLREAAHCPFHGQATAQSAFDGSDRAPRAGGRACPAPAS